MKDLNNYSKKTFLIIVLFSLTSIFSITINAQEEKQENTFSPHHQIGITINHVHVFEGKNEVLTLPAWGVDYTYVFHPKWAVGLHNDFIIENFKVEKTLEGGEGKETVEISYPIAPALMGIYKPGEHWSFLLGMGGEFTKEENYFLTRIATEYGYELPNDWEIFGTLSYDIKWNFYDSWGLGLGIAKNFGGK